MSSELDPAQFPTGKLQEIMLGLCLLALPIQHAFRGDSTESLLMVRLPQFDFVAVGIVYPGEAAVAFVLAFRVDVDAFFR